MESALHECIAVTEDFALRSSLQKIYPAGLVKRAREK